MSAKNVFGSWFHIWPVAILGAS